MTASDHDQRWAEWVEQGRQRDVKAQRHMLIAFAVLSITGIGLVPALL